jgi:hypothetical protein
MVLTGSHGTRIFTDQSIPEITDYKNMYLNIWLNCLIQYIHISKNHLLFNSLGLSKNMSLYLQFS